MRTSLSQQIQSSLVYTQVASTDLAKSQERAVTGKRILRTSDDVPGTNRALGLRSAISTTQQFANNIDVSRPLVTASMNALSDLLAQVKNVRTIAVAAANTELVGGTSDSQVAQLTDILNQMQDIANTKHLDQFVFSGTATDQPAITEQIGDPPYTYTGNTGIRQTQVLSWVTLSVSIPGSKVFNFDGSAGVGSTDLFSMVTDLQKAIESGDPNQVSAQLSNIDKNYSNLLTCSAQMGSWAARMDRAGTVLSDSTDRLKEMLSDTEDIDMAQAVVDLKTQENIYQTALAVNSRMLNLSLASLNYMQ